MVSKFKLNLSGMTCWSSTVFLFFRVHCCSSMIGWPSNVLEESIIWRSWQFHLPETECFIMISIVLNEDAYTTNEKLCHRRWNYSAFFCNNSIQYISPRCQWSAHTVDFVQKENGGILHYLDLLNLRTFQMWFWMLGKAQHLTGNCSW